MAAADRVDVAVVGRGMIGAAAARHLAESGRRVALVGPDEPADRPRWNGPFSSHADEGRITRISDADPVWALAAQRSIDRYADIAARSGIDFHDPRGLVVAADDIDDWLTTGAGAGADVVAVDPAQLAAETGIVVPEGQGVAREGPPAGLINPRRLVRAQTALAAEAGAALVNEVATELTPIDGGIEVGGGWGAVRADRVVVATGAFGHGLIDRRLRVVRRPRTVLVVELDEPSGGATAGPSLARLPSLITREAPDDRLARIYWVPPVRYPDGRVCLKIGGSLATEPSIGDGPEADAELIEWFHGDGDPVEADALRHCVEALLPGFAIRSTTSLPCVYTGTPSGYPAIDHVDERVAVAIGGNGSAAKSSDELGRLAAALVADDDLGFDRPSEVFAADWR